MIRKIIDWGVAHPLLLGLISVAVGYLGGELYKVLFW